MPFEKNKFYDIKLLTVSLASFILECSFSKGTVDVYST